MFFIIKNSINTKDRLRKVINLIKYTYKIQSLWYNTVVNEIIS